MLEMADLQPGDVVYDLGSGDGRVLIRAAREYGAHAVGIEVDLIQVLWTRLLINAHSLQERVEIKRSNIFNEYLGNADVIIVHLRQDTNIKLMPKLWKELRPGTRVISNTFIFPGWEVEEIDKELKLYLYHIRPRRGDS